MKDSKFWIRYLRDSLNSIRINYNQLQKLLLLYWLSTLLEGIGKQTSLLIKMTQELIMRLGLGTGCVEWRLMCNSLKGSKIRGGKKDHRSPVYLTHSRQSFQLGCEGVRICLYLELGLGVK